MVQNNAPESLLPADAVLKGMEVDFEKAAEIIRRHVDSGSPILMRHHSDCDGICAALSIYLSLKEIVGEGWDQFRKKLLVFQNHSAVYELRSVLDDLELFRQMQSSSPLAILLDFSTNGESVDSLKSLRKAGFSILIADHHPFEREVSDTVNLLVSPWLHGGNSDYCAGLLAGEIAKRLRAFRGLDELQKISLIGDKSKLFPPTDEELKQKALVLDFMSASSDFSESLDAYYSALGDRRSVESIYKRAMKKIDFVRKDALGYSKLKELGNGFRLIILNLGKLRIGEFPPKGRVAGEVLEEFGRKLDAPIVVIAYDNCVMHFRANSRAREAGFNANLLIGELKNEMKDAIESGGGHDVAAGLRVNKGFERMVLEEIAKKVGEIGR